jgi:hypothetical protein
MQQAVVSYRRIANRLPERDKWLEKINPKEGRTVRTFNGSKQSNVILVWSWHVVMRLEVGTTCKSERCILNMMALAV